MKTLFAPKRNVSLRLAGLLGILMLSKLTFAAQATGPVSLQGLPDVLLQITIYPFIGVALAFLIFKATNKAWVFLLIPFFYWGLSSLAPIVHPFEPAPEDSLVFYSSVVAWIYLPHILATAIGYRIYNRTQKVWIFFLVPVLGLILQFVSLKFIFP